MNVTPLGPATVMGRSAASPIKASQGLAAKKQSMASWPGVHVQGQVERREVQLKDGGARVAARVKELRQDIADLLKQYDEGNSVRVLQLKLECSVHGMAIQEADAFSAMIREMPAGCKTLQGS